MVLAQRRRPLRQTPVGKSSGEVKDSEIDVSLPQAIEHDTSDFTFLFTFVGLVPVVLETSRGKFYYVVIWRQFVHKVS